MTIPAFYPVFENGQVLTSEQLNNILDYLEPQGRLTRSRLIGIGIVCGLRPNWDDAAKTIRLTRGVAVTSEGHLITSDEVVFDRAQAYRIPIPSSPTATPEEINRAQYPFLFQGRSQRAAFELVPEGMRVDPAGPAAVPLTSAFVADKSVLLFLEATLESLKNCDVNDCSDKGSEMNLTLRPLLISRDDADAILELESGIANEPVDRATHPRLALTPLALEKINPSGSGIQTLSELYIRTLSTAGVALHQGMRAMRDAYAAYEPLLRALYPAPSFPEGPIPEHHLFNMAAGVAETPTLVQYFHAGAYDIVRSYNEFLECAATFDAACSPDERRFPRHVLAGDVESRPIAFRGAPRTLAEFATYDAASARDGHAPEPRPAARRHHFIPSYAVSAGNDRVAEIQSLFARSVLMTQTWSLRGLLDAEIRLTPSRDGAAPMGDRAIPFYYRFDRAGGDLLANWSYRKVRTHRRGGVNSWQFSALAPHPFRLRQDSEDFIRIEGVVGKPLGFAMQTLIDQKRALGLSFGIEPVWIGLLDDPAENAPGRQLAMRATRQLLACRMRDLDVVFLMIMSGLFSFLVWLTQLLGRLNATLVGRKPLPPIVAPPLGERPGVIDVRGIRFINLDAASEAKLRVSSERALSTARLSGRVAAGMIHELASAEAGAPLEDVAVASVFNRVRDRDVGGELFDRVRVAVGDLGLPGDRDELTGMIYPVVALMARTEEMMQAVTARSIADFDEARFDKALRGFADAYENYATRAEVDATKVPKPVADANEAILDRRGLVASMASQFHSAGITAELRKRLEAMFDELTFPSFAQRHPGMEHKGGVPDGGTFVLVYGSAADIAGGLREALGTLGSRMPAVFREFIRGNVPAIDLRRSAEAFSTSATPRNEDVLDNFVVLADFCLPYKCCDSDCSDDAIDRRIRRKEVILRRDDIHLPIDSGGAVIGGGTPVDRGGGAPVDRGGATPAGGGGAPVDRGGATPVGGGGTPVDRGGATPAGGGGTPVDRGGATPVGGGGTPVDRGGGTPVGGGTPIDRGGGTPVGGGGTPVIGTPGIPVVGGTPIDRGGGVPRRQTTGTVVISVFRRIRTLESPLDGAVVTVTDRDTDRSTDIQLRTNTHTQELPAGKYAFVAKAGRSSLPVEIALRVGETIDVKLVVL